MGIIVQPLNPSRSPSSSLRSDYDRNPTELRPRSAHIPAVMRPKSDHDLAGSQLGAGRIMIGFLPNHDRVPTRSRSGSGQITVGFPPNRSRVSTRSWPEFNRRWRCRERVHGLRMHCEFSVTRSPARLESGTIVTAVLNPLQS